MKNILFNFRNMSIRYQLILGVGTVLSVLILFFTFTITKDHSDFLSAQGVKQAKNRAMMLAANARVWVMANDFIGLEEVVKNFSIYDDLRFAAVINMDGKVIAHTQRHLIGQYIADKTRINYLEKRHNRSKQMNDTEFFVKKGPYIDVAHIIHFDDKDIGWVHLRIAQTVRLANINATIKQGVIFTIIALFSGFLLSYLSANNLTRQLMQLINIMKRIRQHGSKNIRASENGVAEVSQLSGEFNQMLDTLDKNKQKLEQTQEELRQDIRQRVNVEQEIRHLNENLESIVSERTEELTVEKNRAEVANYSKSVFLANMSHELRTPLNAILGFSQLMQDDPVTSDLQHSNLAIINRSGEHLLTLINDVLEMSKIEAGHVVLEPKTIDLEELVRDIMDMMENRAEVKHLQLVLETSPLFPRFVITDAPKLRQIIINLLSNAVKFTDEGGITLRMDIAAQEEKEQLKLIFEVEDSGVGMSAEELQTIFKPFIQVGQVEKQTGTGLGLAISKQYIELMGGQLNVKSKPGNGSLFSASIIVDTASEESMEKTPPVKGKVIGLESGQPDYRILSVEDKWENQLLLLKLLESVGIEIRCVENGKEAVDVFSQWHPHLIWMDRRMPIMDGLQATRAIRKLDGGKDVSIIALTASVFEEQKSEVFAAGLDDFIRKPYRPEEIFDCLTKHLGMRFIYADDEHVLPDTLNTDLTAKMLGSLSADLLARFYEAVVELDIELCMSIIEKIKPEHTLLAEKLEKRVELFDFRELKRLLDEFERLKNGRDSEDTI